MKYKPGVAAIAAIVLATLGVIGLTVYTAHFFNKTNPAQSDFDADRKIDFGQLLKDDQLNQASQARSSPSPAAKTTLSSPTPTPEPTPSTKKSQPSSQPTAPTSFSDTNSFRNYILSTYGFTSHAQDFIKNNSTITVKDLSNSCGGGGWRPWDKTVELNCAQHEAAVHELAHVWWHTRRIQNPQEAKGLARDLVRLADGDGTSQAVSFARGYVYGTGDWSRYCTDKGCADVHNIVDGDFDLTESASNAKINDWEIFAGFSSWTMGKFQSGSHVLPSYLWQYFEPQFTGNIQITPYYDGGHP